VFLLSKRQTRAALAAAAVAAIFAVILPALPARATATGTMCTAFGADLCLGVGNSSLGEQVISVNGPGRTMFWGGGGFGTTGTLAFKNNTGLCIAPSQNSDNVKVVTCNVAGVSWRKVQAPNATYWVNVRYGGYLSGDDHVGDIIIAAPHPFNGWEQQWVGPA
jgi:hypothetical protein